jgi:quercetin dioxygenase-like cupin family protein
VRLAFPEFWDRRHASGALSVEAMTYHIQHTAAGEGAELIAPDAVLTVKIAAEDTDGQYELFEVDAPRGPTMPLHKVGWAKAYYVLQGRMIVQVDDEGYDLGPGWSITIPARAPHTFTVLSPAATFLVVSLTGGMGRFHADLDASVPHGLPVEDVAERIQQVLGRHDVTLAGLEAVR